MLLAVVAVVDFIQYHFHQQMDQVVVMVAVAVEVEVVRKVQPFTDLAAVVEVTLC
jgi:hypothetical protein